MVAAHQRERRLRLELAPLEEDFLQQRGEIDGRKLQRHLPFRETGCIEDRSHQGVDPVEVANDGGGKLLLGPRGLHLLQLAHQQLRAHPCGAERRLDLVRQPVEHLFTKAVTRSVCTRFAPLLLDLRNRHRGSERLLHRRLEVVNVHRLGQERVRLVHALRARRAHQQERHRGQLRVGAQRAQQLYPGPPRHHVVADHEIGALRASEEQRLLAILCAERSGARTRMPWSVISNSRRSLWYLLSRIFSTERMRWIRPRSSTKRRSSRFSPRIAIGVLLKSSSPPAVLATSLVKTVVTPASCRRALRAPKDSSRRSTSATDSSSAPRPSITSRRAPSRAISARMRSTRLSASISVGGG